MATGEKNYSMMHVDTFARLGEASRIETGEELGLTGCAVSVNSLPAGQVSAFLHTHKLNEEVYIVINGDGTFKVDGDEFPIKAGSLVRVAPAGQRGINAGDAGLVYLCIQAQEGSLTQHSHADGVIVEG
ncbi:cupin domain-containing protein [Eubacteriales bacterium OttesenSCG-928-A19]|nr:cupin domain-containing protein [Eubacteriales bacterium OttesenSCG-928-A19]